MPSRAATKMPKCPKCGSLCELPSDFLVNSYPCRLELSTGPAGQNTTKRFRIDRTWRAAPNTKELQQIVELPVDVADHRNRRRDVWHILVGLQDLLGLLNARASSIYRPTHQHRADARTSRGRVTCCTHGAVCIRPRAATDGARTFSQRRTTSSSSSGLQSMTEAIWRSRSSIIAASILPRRALTSVPGRLPRPQPLPPSHPSSPSQHRAPLRSSNTVL